MLMQKKDKHVHNFLGSVKNNMAREKGKYYLHLRKMMEEIYQHPNIRIAVQGMWCLTERDQRKSWINAIDL